MSAFKVRPIGNTIQIVNPYVTSDGSSSSRLPSTNPPSKEIILSTQFTKPTIEVPIIPDIPQLKLSTTVVPVIVDEKNKHSLLIDEDSVVDIPLGVKEIFLSLVGGGGAGGLGVIKDGISFSGGGGGAGHGFGSIPIKITDNSVVTLECKIGKGGNGVTPPGGNTSVNIVVNGNVYTCLIGGGGHPGGNGFTNNGGLGGVLNGQNVRAKGGVKGSANITSYPPIGGSGGASLFAAGGKGTSYHMRDHSESNGKWGSGGGGKIPTSPYETPTKGGDGFVIVEYIE